jgi:hypothetical protein
MSIRLDPRRLGALKQLAGEAGLRPGELVLQWVEERIDAERRGGAPVAAAASGDLAGLNARIDELATRLSALEASREVSRPDEPASEPAQGERAQGEAAQGEATQGEATQGEPVARRPGRPRTTPPPAAPAGPRVALHDEITTVIEERGPSTAAEIAQAIAERGRYTPPRSGKALDASTVNGRVSNPAYRSRFTREDGRIGLANRT